MTSQSRSNAGRVDLPGQLDIPGTEAKPVDMVKRLAAAPLQASKPQKPCDVGLFDDTALQIDLEDMLG